MVHASRHACLHSQDSIGDKGNFPENLAGIPEDERFTVTAYIVKKGDTIEKIAKKSGVTVKIVLTLNSMEKVKPLQPGTEINLPPKKKFQFDRMTGTTTKRNTIKNQKKTKTVKTKKPNNKKVLVTALNKKNTAND